MAGTSNSITTHNVLNGVLNADNVISGLVNTAFNPAYALVTQAGAQIVLFINSSDYKMYAQLKDKSGNLIYTSNIIDLPLETMVVDGRYDSGTKKLILVLDNGNEIEVPLGALISGLVNENDLVANYYDKDEIDVLLDGYWTKIELTQEDIDNWNAKQEYLNQGDGIEISADTILKGNTYQESTTGKNLLKNTNVNSGDNNYWNSYSIYDEETGTLTRSTTETTENYIGHRINLKNDTKYTISCLAKSNGYVRSLDIYAYNSTTTKVYSRANISLTTNFQKYSFIFTTDSSTDFTNSTIRFDNNGSTQSGTEAILTIKDVMLVEGEDTEFEPYTNGASPNPDYPQDIRVVSGDNSINVVGKNLLPNNATTKSMNGITFTINKDGSVTINGTSTAQAYINLFISTTQTLISDTTKTYIYSKGVSNADVILGIYEYINSNWVAKKYVTNDTTTYTPSGEQTGQLFRIVIDSGKTLNNVTVYPQLEQGSTATTYEPHKEQVYPINLGNLELCKIGEYQDIIKKSTGKNLAREEFESKYSLTGSGDNRTVAVAIYKISEIIEVQPNTTYTISGTFTDFADNVIRIAMFDNLPTTGSISTKYISSASSPYTFTTDTNTKYILIWNSGGAGDTIIHKLQLELGSSQTTYEPYGTGWYVKKEIGKVVLDGSETISNYAPTSLTGSYQATFETITKANSTDKIVLSDYFISALLSERTTKTNICYTYTDGLLRIATNVATTIEDFKTWLSTHNTTLYYVLATPTYTGITDSTLISQLNALIIGFSNNWVENVSQTNADLPFEIEYDNKNLTISASSNLVRNTDYATSNTGGVIKIGYYNFNISEGRPYVTTTSYADYQNLGNGAFIGKGTLENVITGKALETTNNKVTSISSSSTDTQYPSAKCVYDLIGNLETILTTLDIGTGVE